jgi:thymidylate synthase (FAD)
MEKSMTVKLINYSQVPWENVMGVDVNDKINLLDQIAYCARVSNPSNQDTNAPSDKLVRYLIKNQHWSPFEMVSACLEINTTRDIARQILRHRSFSFQEFSQRYADASQLGFEPREARYQDTKNRQNSTELDLDIDDDRRLAYQWELMQNDILKRIQSTYEWALEKGIAKEQARAILPEGMTKSRMYMNGTLRSWIHYIQLRSGNGTQKEHREVAIACAKALEPVFPMITEFITQ